VGKEDWNRCDFKCLRNVMRVVHERTWGGRLFQTVAAAVRKAREPNEKLDRATDKTSAEADRKALHGLCWWSRLARYGGLPVFKALKVSVAILNLIRASMGSHNLCIHPHAGTTTSDTVHHVLSFQLTVPYEHWQYKGQDITSTLNAPHNSTISMHKLIILRPANLKWIVNVWEMTKI